MAAVATPADLRRWVGARSPTGGADAWLEAAGALRHAALGVPGVAGLSDSAAFQTRGRGAPVGGVALAPRLGGGIRADLALVVVAEAAREADRLEAVVRLARQVAQATWDRLGGPTPLDLQVHVVDVGPETGGADS